MLPTISKNSKLSSYKYHIVCMLIIQRKPAMGRLCFVIGSVLHKTPYIPTKNSYLYDASTMKKYFLGTIESMTRNNNRI